MDDSARDAASFVAEVTAALAAELAGAGLAQHAAALTLAADAKRARPALLWQFAQLAGAPRSPALVDAAVMLELVHTASLVHDDIVDGAATRRGGASVNASVGNATAVLVGDDLLVRALQRVAADPGLVALALHTIGTMVAGVAAEVAARGDVGVTEAQWHAIATGKTASLFALCGAAAGHLAGRPVIGDTLARAGTHLGLAFQAADDAGDLRSGDDLRERNVNLGLAVACGRSTTFALRLARAWSAHRLPAEAVPALVAEAQREGGVATSEAVARREIAAAMALLSPLATTPCAEAALRTIVGWADALATLTMAAGAPPAGAEAA